MFILLLIEKKQKLPMCLSSESGTSKAPRRRKPFNVVSSGLRENCKAHCKA